MEYIDIICNCTLDIVKFYYLFIVSFFVFSS